MIRVRFAPSPTGYLHIGGGRTALFNWLYARSKGGKFVLRIEDTDKLRSKQEFVDEILDSLTWLGFGWDEIYYQSQRFDIYRQHAKRLLQEGKAYVEKTEGKGEAIFYKVTPQKIVLHDLIRGKIEFDASVLKDQVLIKSDGSATYNFACVVDDALMNITDVVRGDDHISNTPKQILLYQALGFPVPRFAHLPLIMGMEGGRLSKRTGATAISDYRNMGYLAPALVNYLLLLSWSPGGDREIIDTKEAVKIFDIKDVNKTAATFDLKKLDWVNNQYLKAFDTDALVDLIIPLLLDKGLVTEGTLDRKYIFSLVQLFQPRMTVIGDFVARADFFFTDEPVMDPEAQAKHLSVDLSREFGEFVVRLDALPDFTVVSIEEAFRALVADLHTEAKKLIHPIRVALTGKTVGPGLFEVIYSLGRERSKKRLLKWVKGAS
ncbi:MAG TPA: glutamate--tRNA ligase [Candidatus Omnitrophota bacterium]|nr:glutamate--tRNA ligase [Candidatus Omnitrophota bacterium]HPT07150.1 glutamate--tRNA ligase [Candidatus Omnitrophota bacterium]